MAVPIWKDYYVSLGAVASQYFRIRYNSTTIYQGKAVRAASSGNLYVRINDICADYMAQTPPMPNATPSLVTFPISFVVQKSSNGTSWITVETVSFNDDWSYQDGFDPSVQGYSFPITGRVDLRQMVYQTMGTHGTVNVAAKYGTTSRTITRATSQSSDGTAFQNALTHAGTASVMFPCPTHATYSGKKLTQFTIGSTTYVVTNKCCQFVLYYKNPFGGYDHLLLEGKCRKNHSGARDTFVANYNNAQRQREDWTFQNEVTERYTLNTGFLSDDESSRMPYLLDSPDVYLVDLNHASIYIPVTIATDNYEIKKYTAADGMINYQFEVAVSQKEYRR